MTHMQRAIARADYVMCWVDLQRTPWGAFQVQQWRHPMTHARSLLVRSEPSKPLFVPDFDC